MTYYPRWQIRNIIKALETRRVVIVAGARQCGKTSVVKHIASSSIEYRTLDDRDWRLAAAADPHEFVKHTASLMIIDEIQKAVDLLPAIKICVDENNRPGQFLLTGSAHISSLPGVTESLAGRIRSLPLRPLAQGEYLNHQPEFLSRAFSTEFDALKIDAYSRDDIIEIALRGGYPEPLSFSSADRRLWHLDYIETLIERDLKDIANIQRTDAFRQLLKATSAWSSKLMDVTALGSGLSLQRRTVEAYLNALETLYLIERIPAYAQTDYVRVGKTTKLIMNDSGLLSSYLRLTIDDVRFDGDRVGKLIETHVANELRKQLDVTQGDCIWYHYRDRENREIDFIIENLHGDLLGIEVKASTSVTLEDCKHLRWFKEHISPKNKKFIGIVLYTGNRVLSLGNGFWAVPIAGLY